MQHRWRAAGLAVVVGLAPATAAAQVACEDISAGAPILYGAGGSAQTSLVGLAAGVLQGADDPIHLVYKDDGGACSGIDALTGLGPTSITGSAWYWDDAGAKVSCNLPLSGEAVDFASMGNSPFFCPLVTDPSFVEGIVDVTGPISSVNLLVANASSQQAISAEAAYLVYGFGPDADVAPWNNPDPGYYIRRNENSYVQQYVANAITLPAAKFYGVDAQNNTNSIAWLVGLADPEQGIAFTSGEVADANRASVRTLAYQHFGQNAAYWPDSSATAFDKLGVRTGQYFLWGAGHFYALEGAGGDGTYADPDARVLLEYLSGQSAPAGASATITDLAIQNRNVPTCAMYATRDTDLGPIYAYAPPEPCHCLFEARATGATTCDACDEDNPCASGTCRTGYCEEY